MLEALWVAQNWVMDIDTLNNVTTAQNFRPYRGIVPGDYFHMTDKQASPCGNNPRGLFHDYADLSVQQV